ncbi:unnamed protein product [Sphagnum balticum]
MEETLAKWILANQEHIPISGDLIKENVAKILDRLHPGHELFEFSNEKIDMLQAIRLAIPVRATDVKIATIQNCYRHRQIRTTEGPGQAALTEEDLIDEDVIDELKL